jgi:uncharacterized protein
MNLVLDTNVALSAVYRGGLPLRVLQYCLETESAFLHLSEEILDEYRDVFSRSKFLLSELTVTFWIERITRVAIFHQGTIPPLDFPRDRKDAKFLALALFVDADYLITGDGDFSDVPEGMLPETRIVSALEFCRRVGLV